VNDRGKLYGWIAFVAIFAAISYASRFSGETPDDDILYTWSAAIYGAVELGIICAIALLIARGRPAGEYLGLRRPTSWGTAAGLGLLVVIAVVAIAAVLAPLLHPGEEQGLVPDDWRPDRAAPFAANFVVVALLAPVVEELMYRGIGYRLLEPLGRWSAVVLVGIAFGLAHGLVGGLPILAAFGVGLAYLRSRTRSVYPGIILHGAFNSIVLTLAVTT